MGEMRGCRGDVLSSNEKVQAASIKQNRVSDSDSSRRGEVVRKALTLRTALSSATRSLRGEKMAGRYCVLCVEPGKQEPGRGRVAQSELQSSCPHAQPRHHPPCGVFDEKLAGPRDTCFRVSWQTYLFHRVRIHKLGTPQRRGKTDKMKEPII